MKNAKENKTFKNVVKGTFVAGALMGAAALSSTNTSSLFSYDVLGSGSEVRSEILHSGSPLLANLDAACGEKAAETKTTETKSAEMKCGEGKCGEAATDSTKTEEKAAETKAATTESKTPEAKCGEGKCGK